jgi:cob(I)alamin adenosyltransferase
VGEEGGGNQLYFSHLTGAGGGEQGGGMTKKGQRGCFQVYTGDGKGKTTAALGLALRASGRGMPVYIGQFMKGQDYGELHALPRLGTVTVEQYGDPGWVYRGKVTEEQRALARAGLEKGRAALVSGRYRIVILDEINMAVWFGLIGLEEALGLVAARPPGVELVFTGRRADAALIEAADLVTEMREVKHYYAQGVPAREGIEK